jgi:hypothetical protein
MHISRVDIDRWYLYIAPLLIGMELVQPIDFEILAVLAEHGRNAVANLVVHLDCNRSYLNSCLQRLRGYGLVSKIGPAATADVYELTKRGYVALVCRDRYREDDPIEFERLISETVGSIKLPKFETKAPPVG